MNTGVQLVLLLALVPALCARADEGAGENRDLDLIPPAAQAPQPAAATTPGAADATRKIYLEEAFTQSWLQGGIVPAPPGTTPAWEQRLLLDVRRSWRLSDSSTLTYSGRLNLRAEPGLDAPSHQNVINDLREAYAGWEPGDGAFVDVGRINLKSGVALGFNPTDFFRTRAVAEPLSVDPVVLRDDRLGTLMVRAQRIWSGASLTAAYAPAVASETPVYTDATLRSFDPMLDRTNARNRLLLKGSVDLGGGFSPELLFYHEGSQTRWGANLTQSIGQSVVAYAEWSGGRRSSLIDDALGFGRRTGTLPAQAPAVLPDDPRQRFASELAAGASYTTAAPKITLNAELIYDQSAFSGADWDAWFRAGQGAAVGSPAANPLWYVRGYALEQQQPVSRSSAFVRADWVDALVPKLDLSAFAFADLLDGSARIQLTADYYLSGRWTVGGLVLVDAGARRSDFGSLPQAGSLLLRVTRYL